MFRFRETWAEAHATGGITRQPEGLLDLERMAEDCAYWRVLLESFATRCGYACNSWLGAACALRVYRGELMQLTCGDPGERLKFAEQVLVDEFKLFCTALLGDWNDGDCDTTEKNEDREGNARPGD